MQLDLPMVAQTLDYTCGAACFDSMFRYFNRFSFGEMHFAGELGALQLGFTPPESVVKLAHAYGLKCEMKKGAVIADLLAAVRSGKVVFVTWWDEDAGHYSLVKSIADNHILLMDPWAARNGTDNQLPLELFIQNWNRRGAVAITVSLCDIQSAPTRP